MFSTVLTPHRTRSRPWWHRATQVALLLLAALTIYRVFALDVFPVMTADSGHYVEAATAGLAEDPLSILFPRHFKTAGYPLFLASLHGLAELLDVDFLTLVPLAQRAMLAIACVWLVFALRLASIPLVLFFSSNAFTAQANFVLTEGLTIPVGIFFALSLLGLHRLRNRPAPARSPLFWGLLLVLALTFGTLALTKVTHVVYALLLLTLAFDLRREPGRLRLRRTRIAAVGLVLAGLSAAYLLGVCCDNYRTFGRFTPTIGSERIFYWGLWEQTFVDRPANRVRPELRRFYDRGSPYRFLHRTEQECGGLGRFACTRPVQLERAEELVAAAGTSLARERIDALFAGLVGGGKRELDGLRNRVLVSSGDERAINAWQDKLIKRFGALFNDGQRAAIVPGFAGEALSEESPATAQLLLTLALLGCLLFFALRGRVALHGPCAHSLVCYLLIIGSFAFLLVDLWRYIATPWAVFAVLTLSGAADRARELWQEGRA